MTDLNNINEIEKLLTSLERQNELANRKLLRQEEVQNLLNGFDQKVLSLLDEDSIPHRIYEAGVIGKPLYWRESFSKLADQDDHNKILIRIELLKKVLKELEPDFLKGDDDKHEFYFRKGETYESQKRLYFIMKKAQKSLYIIDQYLDETVLPFIDSLDEHIRIKLLASKRGGIFEHLYNELIKIKLNVEAKSKTDCHDRFIIIDNYDVWDLGTSINGYGKSAFMLKKVTNQDQKQKLMNDFNKWWDTGQELRKTS